MIQSSSRSFNDSATVVLTDSDLQTARCGTVPFRPFLGRMSPRRACTHPRTCSGLGEVAVIRTCPAINIQSGGLPRGPMAERCQIDTRNNLCFPFLRLLG